VLLSRASCSRSQLLRTLRCIAFICGGGAGVSARQHRCILLAAA
jgi:hypothetical protein